MSDQAETSINTVLIVDDHPMTIDGYINLISSVENTNEIEFLTAHNLENAYQHYHNLITNYQNLDIAFLDINLPAFLAQNLNSGADLALLIRESFPKCKIVFITMHNEPLWVNKVIESINPEGFISKNDVNFRTFPLAYKTIVCGEFYYSPTISEARKLFLLNNLSCDQFDSKILILLAEGKKTNSLPEFVGLSLSAIEKRKAGLKQRLIYHGASDEELIQAARKLGLI